MKHPRLLPFVVGIWILFLSIGYSMYNDYQSQQHLNATLERIAIEYPETLR